MQYIHTLYIFYTFHRILNTSKHYTLFIFYTFYRILNTSKHHTLFMVLFYGQHTGGSPLYVVIDTHYTVISSPKLILNISRTAPLII